MERDYTVLPDGSIFWVNVPEDYTEAAEIARDELGNDTLIGRDDD